MSEAILENTSTKSLSLDLGTRSIGWAFVDPYHKNFFFTSETRLIGRKELLENSLLSNLRTLKTINGLPEGWNGENSHAFSKTLIEKVFNIISSLEAQPQIFPTGRNSIQLEFEIGDEYLELEIVEDKIVALIQFGGTDEEKVVKESEIIKLVDNFYAAN